MAVSPDAGYPRGQLLISTDQEEAMNALEKNIAVARGEALASSLLASLAIQALLAMVANRGEFLAKMEAFIDGTLNISGPAEGMRTMNRTP